MKSSHIYALIVSICLTVGVMVAQNVTQLTLGVTYGITGSLTPQTSGLMMLSGIRYTSGSVNRSLIASHNAHYSLTSKFFSPAYSGYISGNQANTIYTRFDTTGLTGLALYTMSGELTDGSGNRYPFDTMQIGIDAQGPVWGGFDGSSSVKIGGEIAYTRPDARDAGVGMAGYEIIVRNALGDIVYRQSLATGATSFVLPSNLLTVGGYTITMTASDLLGNTSVYTKSLVIGAIGGGFAGGYIGDTNNGGGGGSSNLTTTTPPIDKYDVATTEKLKDIYHRKDKPSIVSQQIPLQSSSLSSKSETIPKGKLQENNVHTVAHYKQERDLGDQPRTQESQNRSASVSTYNTTGAVSTGVMIPSSIETYYESLATIIHTKQCTAYNPYKEYYHRRGLSRFIYIYDCHTRRLRWLLLIPVSRLSWLRYIRRRKSKKVLQKFDE